MIVTLVLLVTSLGALLATLVLPGLQDLVVLTAPVALAAAILVADRLWRRRPKPAPVQPRWILVDGSNVLYWKDSVPKIETLREVVDHLTRRGYTPGVVFDANAGHLVSGRYQHDKALGRMLGLPEDRVMVVPKGAPADPTLLAAAREMGAAIVTNDRYRDWADQHPEVTRPGHLVRGGFSTAGLWLDLDNAQ